MVEIKARFDEANKSEWANRLAESASARLRACRTEDPASWPWWLRREDQGLQTYVHIATGNYNPSTSKMYTDLGLLATNRKSGLT